MRQDLYKIVRQDVKRTFCGKDRGTHRVVKFEDRWEFHRTRFQRDYEDSSKPEFIVTSKTEYGSDICAIVVFPNMYSYANEPKLENILKNNAGIEIPTFHDFEGRKDYVFERYVTDEGRLKREC